MHTADEGEAQQIIEARNQAERQLVLNRQIAKDYLAGTDSGVVSRIWRHALDPLILKTTILQMANTCLLCPAQADSCEHYVPNWLSTVCHARELQMVRGTSTGAEVTTPQKIGPLRNAKSRILCKSCNAMLGSNLEERVRPLLSPYVAPNAVFKSLNLSTTEMLVKWMLLRAVEMSVVAKKSLLTLGIEDQLLEICRNARDGSEQKIWKWFTPSLEAVIVQQPTMGYAVSESFFSTERGPVKATGLGFWFFLQMNRLGLFLIYAPNAQRDNSGGYGLKLFPNGMQTVDKNGIRTTELPVYDNIREAYLQLTRLNTE